MWRHYKRQHATSFWVTGRRPSSVPVATTPATTATEPVAGPSGIEPAAPSHAAAAEIVNIPASPALSLPTIDELDCLIDEVEPSLTTMDLMETVPVVRGVT